MKMSLPDNAIKQNVRIALRTLLRQRVFLGAAVLSLGIAIAVNTTMYAMLDALMNPRIAGAHPDRLHTIRYFGNRAGALPPDAVAEALRTGMRSYEAVTGYRPLGPNITAMRGDRASNVIALRVRGDFFAVTEIPVVDGRLAALDDADGVPSIVISDHLRGRLFPDGTSPVGATLTLDGRVTRVVGVARRYVAFDALDADVWMFDVPTERPTPISLIRVRPGATFDELLAELNTVSARLALAAGESPRDNRFYFRPITRQFHVKGLHYALVAAVLAVLLVACANLSNLQLARGLNRARELAVRASLGATRRQLVALLLTESALLALGGLLLGLVFTLWGIHLLRAAVPPEAAGYVVSPDASARMLVFAAAAASMCVILVGLIPAIRLSDVNLDALIKSGAGTGSYRRNRTKYGALVVAQIGLTLPLVTGAFLLARGLWQYESKSYLVGRIYGIDPDSMIEALMILKVPKGTYVRIAPIAASIVGRARAVAGVGEAGVVISAVPPGGGVVALDESNQSATFAAPSWWYSFVTPGYFTAAGLPVERGRNFVDGQAGVIVDRASANFLWPKQNPVGRSIKLGDARSNEPWLTVAGVRGDHLDSIGRANRAWLDTLRINAVYRSITETDSALAGYKGLVVRLSVRPAANPLLVTARLRQALQTLDLVAPPDVMWGRERYGIAQTAIRRRFMSSLFGGGAFICLVLAAFGVYAIVAQTVAQRRREIAVRIFLGATPRGIVELILREGNVFVLAGILIGLLISLETSGWLGMFLGEHDSFVSLYFGAACATLFGFAALAALVPAARATLIDPVEALRSE